MKTTWSKARSSSWRGPILDTILQWILRKKKRFIARPLFRKTSSVTSSASSLSLTLLQQGLATTTTRHKTTMTPRRLEKLETLKSHQAVYFLAKTSIFLVGQSSMTISDKIVTSKVFLEVEAHFMLRVPTNRICIRSTLSSSRWANLNFRSSLLASKLCGWVLALYKKRQSRTISMGLTRIPTKTSSRLFSQTQVGKTASRLRPNQTVNFSSKN